MSFLSLHFAAMVAVLFFVYYIVPKRFQPLLLLIGSLYFYYRCSGLLLFVMTGTSLLAFLFGKLIYQYRCALPAESSSSGTRLKILSIFSVILLLSPLLCLKYSGFLFRILGKTGFVSMQTDSFFSIGLPIGISFYTLQLIAYILDIFHGKYAPETSFLRFLLFTCFFLQILQGPIPRYDTLKETLFAPHTFEGKTVTAGLYKLLFGLFLKLMIADKAALFVDSVFNTEEAFGGAVYLAAGILYSFQLYADFLSCVLLAQGTALLFGIELSENFARPYFASSIKDFWRRWHISLSSWLRDYIYIPLGGNRKGTLRTDCNLLATFLVSGIWHGSGFKYLFWGAMHGGFQLAGKYTLSIRNRFFSTVKLPSYIRQFLQRITTFFLVMSAWIIFRANSLRDGLFALYSILFRFASGSIPGSLKSLGFSLPEFFVLALSVFLLLLSDYLAEHEKPALETILTLQPARRFVLALILLFVIAVFGTYGFGYDANAFIYGGF